MDIDIVRCIYQIKEVWNMTTWKYRNGYVEVYENGIFVGNYDTIEEYQEEKRKKEQEEEVE